MNEGRLGIVLPTGRGGQKKPPRLLLRHGVYLPATGVRLDGKPSWNSGMSGASEPDAPRSDPRTGPRNHPKADRPCDGVAADAAQVSDARTDGDLARLVAAGDQSAAAALVVRYERLVRSFLRKITGRPETADDLAQETFIRLLKHAGRYDEKYPMRTWLLTIARRLSINHCRRADERVGHTEYDGHRSTFDGPSARIEAQDMKRITREILDSAMGQLTGPQREAIVLFHEQDLSIEQVAQVMEVPVGTVKSHLHRARAAMRKLLGPRLEAVGL